MADYRRRAWRLLGMGLGLVAGVAVAGVSVEAVSGEWSGTVAVWAGGGGLGIAVIGVGSVRIAARMGNTLSRGPWIACPAVALPVGTGAPRLVLRVPGSSDFLALTVVAVRQRYHLVVPGGSGVLWWCGDPRRGGVVAQPGGEILAWARPTHRGRRREGDVRRAVSLGLLKWAAPRQPQCSELHGANSSAREVITTPPRRRPLFRWVGLLAALVMGLGIAGSMAAERNPQVDLTVVQEDARGNCSVTWRDPWSGAERHGPFRCDPGRDPILSDWETGFVVSYEPWKGDLYNADLEGTPANAVNDGLFLTGLLGLAGSGIGGGIRIARRVTERRTAMRGSEPGGWPGDDVPRVVLTKDNAADARELTDLSYAAWAELARRTARPVSESTRRREADVRSLPWWRVRTLWRISQLGGVLAGAGGGLAAFLWWRFGGETDVGLLSIVVAGCVTMVISGWRAKSYGLATVRRLVRAARAPVPVLRPYVLVHDPHDGMPVLILFPRHAGPDALPDAVLTVLPPGSVKRPWLGLPHPVGTADLRGWLDEEPTVVPWIEGQALWPLQGLREVRTESAEDRSYLCRLVGDS